MKLTDRIYLRVESDLKRRILEYCDRHGESLSSLVTRFFVRLLEEERKEHDADQF